MYQQVYIHYFNELLVKDEKLGEIHAIKLILTKRCCIVGVSSCDKSYFLGQTAVFFIGAAICSSWPTRPLYWLVNEKLGEIHAIKLILTKRLILGRGFDMF